MKHFLRAAMLMCLLILFLSAWSLPAGAASKVTSTNGHVSLNADGQGNFAVASNRGIGEFYGVAAVSANDIWAVGDGIGTLIEHWNGTQWRLVKSPNPGTAFNNLYSVAAISANNVWAVGSYSDDPRDIHVKTLIEHWNGTQWSVVTSPSPGTAFNNLTGVVAISANNVWAVGAYDNLTLIEHWNGTQWSTITSPSPNNDATLNGVAAVSANNIWAVGYYFSSSISQSGSGGSQTLIEQWNGTQWSVISSPNSALPNNELTGVAAASAKNVWAVGYDSDNTTTQTLIEQWNGAKWSIIPSPNPGSSSNYLFGVAAVSASDVWAVGGDESGTSGERTLVEQWNGTKWSVVPSPNVGTGVNRLNAVTTISASQAWAVGVSVNGAPYQTLTEQWNGTKWSVVSSPNQIGNGVLAGVAAVSASDVWAVGSDDRGALTEHWNGTKWSVVSSPEPGSGGNAFNAAAAVSTSDIWAAGYSFTKTGIQQTLIEQWNGTKWSVVSSPNAGSSGNILNAVAAVSANDVWAVGYSFTNTGVQQTLIEQWNGTKWSIVSSPNPSSSANVLNAVVAVSASNVWAVGYQYNNGIQQTLIERWNGTKWSVVSSPNPGSFANVLSGVTAVSANNVWAVGFYNGTNFNQPLTEHWNGTQWSVVTSPNTLSDSFLYGVAAASASNVWAVGYSTSSSGVQQTLIEHWNGSSWSVVTSPNPGSMSSVLNAVAVISASEAWTVGVYSNNQYASRSLAEYWDGSKWSVVSSPNVR